MKFKFYISLFLSLLSLTLVSQEAKLTATVSKNKLGLNQRLRVEFSINEKGADNFAPPNFEDFRVVGGPSQSISQSYINGRVSFNKSYTYVIQPTRKGELVIPSASIFINGKTILSEPVKIRVLDPVEVPKDPNDPNYIAQQNIHLVAEVSNAKPLCWRRCLCRIPLCILAIKLMSMMQGLFRPRNTTAFGAKKLKSMG